MPRKSQELPGNCFPGRSYGRNCSGTGEHQLPVPVAIIPYTVYIFTVLVEIVKTMFIKNILQQ